MIFLTDNSFEGFLSAVFEAFRLKLPVERIVAEEVYVPQMFEDTHIIVTNAENAARVWKALQKNIAYMVIAAYLSELPIMETVLWNYLRKIFTKKIDAANTLDSDAHLVYQVANKVRHEAHIITGFVRFQKAENGLMVSFIEPTYNVIHLIQEHFFDRFPNMRWSIIDLKRRIIIGEQLEEMPVIKDDYSALWKGYFKSAAIAERKNLRLQKRCLPVKYWKHLTEMG